MGSETEVDCDDQVDRGYPLKCPRCGELVDHVSRCTRCGREYGEQCCGGELGICDECLEQVEVEMEFEEEGIAGSPEASASGW